MYAFVVFLGLALGLTVVMQVIDEIVPIKFPSALTRTLAVALAAGFAWALDYSVFTSFGQSLREQWMHPVATGLVLVGGGEFIRSVVHVLGHRAGEPPVEVAPSQSRVRAA
jgi:hypothetical protein